MCLDEAGHGRVRAKTPSRRGARYRRPSHPALAVVASLLLLATLLLATLHPTPAFADFFDLHVDPTESRVRLSNGEAALVLAPGLTATLAVGPQTGVPGTIPGSLPGSGPGDGLETLLFGILLAETNVGPTQLVLHSTSTEFTGGHSGFWAPGTIGSPGVALANAAFRVEDPLLGIDFLGALRGVQGSVQSTLVLTPDGPDAWTATGSLDVVLTGGTLDYASIVPGFTGSGPLLTGTPPIATAAITAGSYEIVSPGVARLSLPFTTDPFVIYSDQIGGAVPISLTATLQGTLVAYSQAVPEPGIAMGLGVGIAALAAGARRRTRGGSKMKQSGCLRSRLIILGLLAALLLLPACPANKCGIGSGEEWSATFADNSQCGHVVMDVDGDGSPDPNGDSASCVTPSDDTAPGSLASATVPGPGGDVFAELSVTRSAETMSIVCRYELPEALTTGSASCSGSFSRSVIAQIDNTVGAGMLRGFYLTARKVSLGPGSSDPFEAEVFVQCPGELAEVVPLTGETRSVSYFHDGIQPSGACTVFGAITQSSTTAAGTTLHEVVVEISEGESSQCAASGVCESDRDCGGEDSCVLNVCSDGAVGSSCHVGSDCVSGTCLSNLTCATGLLGDPCEVKRHCIGDLVCNAGVCNDPNASTIEIFDARLTPELYLLGGQRPRYTPELDLALWVYTSEPMSQVTATTVACDPLEVSDCTPRTSGPTPPATVESWSVDLPDYASAPAGLPYRIDASVADGAGLPGQASQSIDFEVYPADAGWSLTCTKSYDENTGVLVLSFDVGPPPPLTPADVFDARFWLFQRTDEGGWGFDETDPIRTGFILPNPTQFAATDDGEYQLIYIATPDFTNYFQASLRLDTLGGPNDICTLLP